MNYYANTVKCTMNLNKKHGIVNIECRNECAPIITANVHSDELYDICLLENKTHIRWYVTDIHGFDLLKGYDPYISSSGKTLIPYNKKNNNSLFQYDVILLNKYLKTKDNVVHRYDEYVCVNDIIDMMDIMNIMDKMKNNNIDNELNIAPHWYANFCSLSR